MLQFLGHGVSRGEDYLPDEIAKSIVTDKKLSKGQTISKREILDFLNEKGISTMLLTDVAMVLRNVFGLTPTFDEGKTMSASNLIEELSAVLENRDSAPQTKIEESVSAPVGVRDPFDIAVEEAFFSADGELEEAIVAGLAAVGPSMTFDIAEMVADFADADFAEMDECYRRGGMGLVESWGNAKARPHMIRFMEDKLRHDLSEAVEAAGFRTLNQLSESPREIDLGGGGKDVELANQKKKMRPPMVKGTPAKDPEGHKGPPGISVPGISGHGHDAPAASPAAKDTGAPELKRATDIPAKKPEPAVPHGPAHVPPGEHNLSTHPMAQGGNFPPPPEKRVDLDPSAKRGGLMKRGMAAMGSVMNKVKALHAKVDGGNTMDHGASADHGGPEPGAAKKPGLLARIGHAATNVAKSAIAAPFGALGYGAGIAAGGIKKGLGMMGRGFHAAYAAGQHTGANTPLAKKAGVKAPGLAYTLYGHPGDEHGDSGISEPVGGPKRKFPKKKEEDGGY